MTRHEYETGIALDKADTPLYGLIMAAMLRADSSNRVKLIGAWPEVYAELDARYWTPGGIIKGDREYDPAIHQRRQ